MNGVLTIRVVVAIIALSSFDLLARTHDGPCLANNGSPMEVGSSSFREGISPPLRSIPFDDAGTMDKVLQVGDCVANAGTLTAHASSICFTGVMVNITATWNNPVVPSGYQGLFLLTTGPTQVIVQGSVTPAFNVAVIGVYTMHALVYDPTTLNLGTLTFGQSTLDAVDVQLQQGGGGLCGGLDMLGASFVVQDCSTLCDAFPGSLTAMASVVCSRTGSASISALPNGDAAVPAGFGTAYLLSYGSGSIIGAFGGGPHFDVGDTGAYAIHTLIYDPGTFDLSDVVPGSTTISLLNELFAQGGGSICAGLDVSGAHISVDHCRPQNDDCINAIQIAISAVGDCNTNMIIGSNTYAIQEDGNLPICDPDAGPIADVWYTFNSGANTEVSMVLGPVSMSNWAMTVAPTCGGSELACEIGPAVPIDVFTLPNTEYRVRIYSDLDVGSGGAFVFCVTGSHPTFTCVGGTVGLSDDATTAYICKDGNIDMLEFTTTSHSEERYAFVLADHMDTVVSLIPDNTMDFDTLHLGIHHVWGVSYRGDLNTLYPGIQVSEITSTDSCLELSNGFFRVDVGVCTGFRTSGAELWTVGAFPGEGLLNVHYHGPTAMVFVDVIGMDGRLMVQQHAVMGQGQMYTTELGGLLCQGMYTVRLRCGNQLHVQRIFVDP